VRRKSASGLKRINWLVASVTVALWLLTGFLAVSEDLHQCLHDDADAAQHECLITKYSEGQFLNGPAPAPLAKVADVLTVPVTHVHDVIFASIDFRLPPGRAPPLS
jgi:hypothetical protein